MAKILVVEDDPELSEKLTDFLVFEKHTAEAASDGSDALEKLRFYEYDLIILDWMLPELPGIEVCRQFRQSGGTTPILMLTGRNAVTDRTEGLDVGADDYLTKPFDIRELASRVRALLRRPTHFVGNVLKDGEIVLDTVARSVTKGGVELKLQPLEFALLEFFMRHSNQAYSPEALLNHVWGSESDASIDTLRTYIKTLRRKIDREGQQSSIRTIHGVGYKYEASD